MDDPEGSGSCSPLAQEHKAFAFNKDQTSIRIHGALSKPKEHLAKRQTS
jgi:hypothetical protein